MLRYLVVFVLAVGLTGAAALREEEEVEKGKRENFVPRVIFYDQFFATRDEAVHFCEGEGHCIAHESQIKADLRDGYTGHAKCGFTWRRDGRPVHGHCVRRDANNKCLRRETMVTTCSKEAKHGVYCRQKREGEELPRPCKVEDVDVTEIFRIDGPFKSEFEAIAACQQTGAELATWTQAAHFASFYEVQYCQYNFLRVSNHAVYRVNCHHDGVVDWIVKDDDKAYGALCRGQMQHKWHDICGDKYPMYKERELYCTKDDYIIFQDRPICSKEEYSFETDANTWHAWQNGFGEIGKGYWLGLENLYELTNEHKCSLKILFTDHTDKLYEAEYGIFRVDSENHGLTPCESYKLTVGDYKASSTAPDALNALHSNGGTDNGSFFSDKTHDCEKSDSVQCASEFHSGWWYNMCQRGNLNGVCEDSIYYDIRMQRARYWHGVSDGQAYGLKTTRMALKCHDDGGV